MGCHCGLTQDSGMKRWDDSDDRQYAQQVYGWFPWLMVEKTIGLLTRPTGLPKGPVTDVL